MSRRSRVPAYASAGTLVGAGATCAALVSGDIGQVLAMALIGLGLVALLSLVFYEVGLSEDRERASRPVPPPPGRPELLEPQLKLEPQPKLEPQRQRQSRPGGRPRRPDRMRGRRRRLD